MDIEPPETFSIVGAGRVASALSRALEQRDIRALVVANRTLEAAKILAAQLEGARGSSLNDLKDLPGDLVVLCISDDALVRVAEMIAEQVAGPSDDWTGRLVIHTSGTWTSDILAAFNEAGALTASFHPLQTFANRESQTADIAGFNRLPIGIEGDERAASAASAVARALGSTPFIVSASAKGLFHAAAVMASNYLVTLQAMAQELSEVALGEDDPEGGRYSDLFGELTKQALSNTLRLGPRDALTGPIVRGDIRVLHQHLQQIKEHAPHLTTVYAALATETIRLASDSGRVNHEIAEVMLDLLTEYLPSEPRGDILG
ncbi:MAG: DUF2520 domain-containing protein [Rhodothermia bacterium]|nr:MAG: DUF2520 domain-containing protein [Rhodothermia bacterium]